MEWVTTDRTLGEFGGDPKQYRAFVEAGRGERPVSPFERAFAGLILGGEAFIARVRKLVGTCNVTEQPAAAALRRSERTAPEAVEAAVDAVFPDTRARLREWHEDRSFGCGGTVLDPPLPAPT